MQIVHREKKGKGNWLPSRPEPAWPTRILGVHSCTQLNGFHVSLYIKKEWISRRHCTPGRDQCKTRIWRNSSEQRSTPTTLVQVSFYLKKENLGNVWRADAPLTEEKKRCTNGGYSSILACKCTTSG